jgi:ankyrin repeat protein
MKRLHGIIIMFFIIFLSLSGCRTMTPLSKASMQGDINAMNALIKQGCNLNEPGDQSYKATSLHWAASYGQTQAVATLLDAGANVNSLDYCRQTPIFYAINGEKKKSYEMTELLISKGADLNVNDCHGWMPIDYATQNQDMEIKELILSKSPESIERLKNKKIAEGRTLILPKSIENCREASIHKAASAGDIATVKKLIEAKDDPDMDIDEADCFGYRAIDYAERNGDQAMIKIISSKSPKSAKGEPNDQSGKYDYAINFNHAEPTIHFRGTKKLAIAVYDEREYVVTTKEKPPEYVGYTRRSWAGPTDFTTRNKRPIVQTLSTLIAAGFRSAGFDIVHTSHKSDKSAASNLELIVQNKPDRAIIVKVNEWIIETQYWVDNIDFKFSITLSVLDEKGKELFVKEFAGTERIAGLRGYSHMRAKVIAPEVAYYLLTDILNKPEFAAVLK